MGSSLQTVVTVAAFAVTSVLLVVQLRNATSRSRLRPRLDLVRIAVQVTSVVAIAGIMGLSAPFAGLAAIAALGALAGHVQGRNLEITDDDGRLYASRNSVAAIVWASGLVLMQFAGVLRRANVAETGQVVAWLGLGLSIGLLLGRRRPLTDYRTRFAALPAAMVALAVAALIVAASGDESAAQSPVWIRTGVEINPGGDSPPERWTVSISSTSMTVVQSFGPDDTSGVEATFEATWEEPPEELEPGTSFVLDATVSGQVTGSRDAQFFLLLDVILLENGSWLREAVGAAANCAETDIISGEYACSEPQTNTGSMAYSTPTTGDTYTVGVGALNCGGACVVNWIYELRGDAGTATAGAADGDTVAGPSAGVDADREADLVAVEARIDELFGETGIEPDDAMLGALVGLMAALATGGLTLVEALDRVAAMFEAGSTIERTRLPDPVAPEQADEATVMLDDPDLASAQRSGSAFERELAQYVENLPPPGEGVDIGPYIDLLNRQGAHWNRAFTPEEFVRVWDALGGVTTDPSAATADELRHALADLLDRQVGVLPTWLVSWAARNPAAAGEMLARMGAAYATGGGSELALIPTDVYRDVTGAQRAALKRGEPFGFGDAVEAGLRGQAVGWVLDGAGSALNAERRAAGDALGDAARRVGERSGRGAVADGVTELAEEGIEQAARRGAAPTAEELAAASRRNTDADAWQGMREEAPGSKIPPEHIRETGYTPDQARELQRVAAENDVIVGTRETNLDATRFIESGQAVPKPMEVKAKTVNELDELIGGPPASIRGQVGYFEPTQPGVPRDSHPALWDRYDQRLAEWKQLNAEVEAMREVGIVDVRDGVVHKVFPDGTTKPFAGDIDAVAILDARTGRPLAGERYNDVVRQLRDSGAMLQHGAESNIVADIVRHQTSGLIPGTREYNEAFDKAMDKASALGELLNKNHLDGREQVFWTHARGHYRGPQLRRLSEWQSMAGGDIPGRITDPVEIASILRPVTTAISSDE